MPEMKHVGLSLQTASSDFRDCWRRLVLTDFVYNLIGIAILTPLLGVLFRLLISFSGDTVLSDTDILFFFLRPMGLVTILLSGAVWLAIVALGQASLLSILCANAEGKKLGLIGALRFSSIHAVAVVRLTARLVVYTLVVVAPFLIVAGLIYFVLLTEFDINYYLTEKPPEFLMSVAIGGVLSVALIALLLWLSSSWLFALPIVLFEKASPKEALHSSVALARGRRRSVAAWIVSWIIATFVLTSVASGLVALVGRVLVPDPDGSLRLMVFSIGVTMLLLFIVNQIVSLFSITSFATIHFGLYRSMSDRSEESFLHIDVKELERENGRALLNRRRALAGLVVGLVVATLVGATASHTIQLDDNVQIMAHRGSSKAAPENTMAAIRQAIVDDADWVEIDVQENADGEVVVFHDSDFMKLAGNPLKIWDATNDDLEQIDIGSWFSPQFADERVPTLADVLKECRGKINVNIELKYYGHDQQLEKRVAEIVESNGMASHIILMSLKREAVTKMKKIRPEWKVGLLMSVAIGDLKQLDADFLAVNASFATRGMIQHAHSLEKDVFVWTVNDAPTMSVMISRGVDGLITDKPALTRSVLEQRAQMSGPQRLLLEFAVWLGVTSDLGEP
ncbi:MAG: glycerophosphodiester phosphodiesterase [Planctomycetota bacterium]